MWAPFAESYRAFMDEHVVVRPLEERPGAAAQLAEWFMAEWPEYHRGKTLGDVSSMFRLRDVQQTFIAELDGEIVGTVALRKSWSDAPDITTPWIGGLFVRSTDRGHGVAMTLVDAACSHAFSLGHDAVHVAVRVGVDGYEERGWKTVGTMKTGSESVTVLRRDAA
jgi:GNAT superfamily N-acetyltransferase